MVRPMDNSQQPSSGRADSSRVAPYLTHLVTHHGQLTLIPPQNTGRIRKTKGKTQRAERRRDNDEPRFNTAAPVSSRRTQTTAGRLHRPIQPSRVSRDSEVPDYPPPSFSEAIATPPPFPLLDNPNPRPPSPTGRPANERTTSAVHQSDPQIHPQELFERSQTPSETSHARLTPQIDDLHLAPRPISPDNRATTPTSNDSPTEEESESARTSPESPLPHDFEVSSGSGSSSDISSLELVSLDPSQQWEADRQRGLSLEDRVKREHFRKFAAESTTDLIATPKAPIVQLTEQPASGKSPTSKRVRHGTLKSLECTTIPSSSRSPSGGADEGTENSSVPSSPGFQSRFMRVFSSSTSTDQSPPVSPIFTPLSPLSSLSAPWASRTTLVSEKTSPKTQAMKRKESLVFRKLFHVMGKEREKEKEKAKDPISAPESNNEALECWEVVDPDTFQTKSYHGNRNSRIRRESEVSTSRLPIGPLNTSSPAFLNRAVRPMHGGSSVGLPSSPSSLLLASPTRAATSPILRGMYSPAPSLTNGSEAEASTQQKLRVRKPPPSPLTRSLNPSVRQSPSIVWKSNDRPKSPPQTPTSPSVDESPTTPTSAPSPPLVRPRATSALPSLSMPPQIMISNSQQAEPFPLSETPSPPPSPLPAVLQTPTFVRPSLPSLTTPSTPQTPNSRHYAGRPLPQPPTEHSPFGRPIYSPSPPPSAPPTPQQQRHRSTPAIFSQYTDFDALVSRIEDGPHDGRHYDDLLLISEVIGDAEPSPGTSVKTSNSRLSSPPAGRVEVERRRVTKEGRIRLKLTLLGVTIDRCSICQTQFKDGDEAAMGANCQHAFHDRCLMRLLAVSQSCPNCRAPLSVPTPRAP